MTLITISELKDLLDLNGVDYSAYNDEQLQQLLTNKIVELEGLAGVCINPKSFTEKHIDYNMKILELRYYPVTTINDFTLNGKQINEADYILDENLGVIYFNHTTIGNIIISYTVQLPSNVIDTLVNPLIVDMFTHMLNGDNTGNGEISSIKEVDVTVSYDTSSNLYASIMSRIGQLKGMYACRAVLI